MTKILDRLFLGGLDEALNTNALKKNNVTHILTVDNQPLSREKQRLYTCKFVMALDVVEENLLISFDECIRFIDEGRLNGGVLVHCFVGSSRSATIVIAYVMYRNKLKFKEALEFVKNHRNCVNPNNGFVSQLQLFEEMGHEIDIENNSYKQFRVKYLAKQMDEGKLDMQVIEANPLESVSRQETVFRCKLCRTLLFRSSSLLFHNIGVGESAFSWKSRMPSNKRESKETTETCKTSIFIEPVQWMANIITTQADKIGCYKEARDSITALTMYSITFCSPTKREAFSDLSCPKCSCKLGSFVWHGERCSCGAFVVPAFHIQTSKVDECKRVALLPQLNTR